MYIEARRKKIAEDGSRFGNNGVGNHHLATPYMIEAMNNCFERQLLLVNKFMKRSNILQYFARGINYELD